MKGADFLFLSSVVMVVTGLAMGVSRPIALRAQVQASERQSALFHGAWNPDPELGAGFRLCAHYRTTPTPPQGSQTFSASVMSRRHVSRNRAGPPSP